MRECNSGIGKLLSSRASLAQCEERCWESHLSTCSRHVSSHFVEKHGRNACRISDSPRHVAVLIVTPIAFSENKRYWRNHLDLVAWLCFSGERNGHISHSTQLFLDPDRSRTPVCHHEVQIQRMDGYPFELLTGSSLCTGLPPHCYLVW